jgi:hypothetical protein
MARREETPAEFRERLRSIGFKTGNTKQRSKIITHPETGERANRIEEFNGDSNAVITQTDNRQDVNITPKTHVQSLSFMENDGRR